MKALPSVRGYPGRMAFLNCFVRPLPVQSHRLLYTARLDIDTAKCSSRLSSKPRGISVKESMRWNTTFSFRSSEEWKLGQSGLGFRTLCNGSENLSQVAKDERGAAGKILQESFLIPASHGLQNEKNKPELCTADELHYVAVPGTNWRLALWRYHPSPSAEKRNHPLILLSGIGTNAIGFDLDPSVSMARYMAESGFDTWILEVRGAGLSKSEAELENEADQGSNEGSGNAEVIQNGNARGRNGSAGDDSSKPEDAKTETSSKSMDQDNASSEQGSASDYRKTVENSLKVTEAGVSWEAWSTATRISNTIVKLAEKLTRLVSQGDSNTISARFVERISSLIESNLRSGKVAELREWLASLIEARESGTLIPSQIAELRERLAKLLEDGQVAVSPTVNDWQERLSSTVDEFQRIVDLIAKYDWDFDNYLNEDVPTAMEYIQNQTKPIDGKVLAVGHSMGGIVLYAHLSTRGCNSGLAGAVALASALDYGVSDTTLKLLLPLTDPAQLLNVPVVPLGALMAAIQPLMTRPPYPLGWLGYNVSAQNMMETPLFNKLVLNNFGTIPVKLLLHLATVFQPGGLQNRDGTIKYKENICKVDVPVLALAADKDLICPPIAVLDTVKEFPKEMITYKVFGGEDGRHYGHYDLVCSPAAKEEVYPYIRDFLIKNDALKVKEKEVELKEKDDEARLEVSKRGS